MNAKLFSYKAEGIILKPSTKSLRVSQSFNCNTLLDELKEKFRQENYTIDEASLNYKIKDDQLYIEGLAIENKAPKSVGFRFGKDEAI